MSDTIFIIVVAVLAIGFGDWLFFATWRALCRKFGNPFARGSSDSDESREQRYKREEREARERYHD